MKQACIRIIALTMLWGLSAMTYGATFNAEEPRDHGAWSSVKLSLGDQRFYRAINIDDYSDMRVMIDFDSEECEPELEVQIDNNRSFSETETIGIRKVAARVDRKPIHESLIQLATVSGDNTLYGYVLVGDLPRLISEMRLGQMVRFKFSMADESSDPMYAELSLNGSRAALDRARALCSQDQVGPEEYFEEGGTSQDESAAEYF
ncbi:hypothetical protein FMN52_00890 [Marinobacter sp. BW6]|uniref:hypothetical protein n=1 Tax=Marinobacter sp. BW6 TaxID=2592624 RepID=UPI0011DE8EEA|nr:hypothetical protein [Marinobacter sp. BW6]TYC63813.1 hypothetical protein FMN52_00890 [Marinobacter sp. BW6]